MTIQGCDMEKMKDRNVILVEDIIDTGKTMQALIPYFESYGVRSVVVCIDCLFFLKISYQLHQRCNG